MKVCVVYVIERESGDDDLYGTVEVFSSYDAALKWLAAACRDWWTYDERATKYPPLAADDATCISDYCRHMNGLMKYEIVQRDVRD